MQITASDDPSGHDATHCDDGQNRAFATAGRSSKGAATNATYAALEDQITDLTARRNDIAGKMIAMLENAAFNNQKIDEEEAKRLIDKAQDLLGSTH